MIGTITSAKDIIILENSKEYLNIGDSWGIIGVGVNLLPVVTLNGQAVTFSRQELIDLAISKLTAE